MLNEFSRTELLIGPEAMARIRKAKVLVFGVGGVGSHCIEAIARCGVGTLILVDNDVVSLTNINRQSIAYHSTMGNYKTKLMKERIFDISPETEVITYEEFVLPDNVDTFFGEKPDYVVDAIDTVSGKIAIILKAQEMGIPLLSSMGTGNKIYGDRFEITDISKTSVCPLCKVMRKELRNRGVTKLKVLYSKEPPIDTSARAIEKPQGSRRSVPGSVSFVPPVAGLLIAGEVLRDLGGFADNNG